MPLISMVILLSGQNEDLYIVTCEALQQAKAFTSDINAKLLVASQPSIADSEMAQ